MSKTQSRALKIAICEALGIDPIRVTDVELQAHAQGIVHLRIGLYPEMSDEMIKALADALKEGGHVVELWNGGFTDASRD